MDSLEKKRPRRKEREKERHRREILDAAEKVFVRKGHYLATVEEIAEEAEFSVGTIYNFFENKEDLYVRVIEKIAHDFFDVFEKKVLSNDDPVETIGALIELRLTLFERHRGFFRVFFETSPASHVDPVKALPKNLAVLYDDYIASVSAIFKHGMKKGLFEKTDPFYLTLCLEGIINAFVAYWARREPTESLETRVEKMKAEFLGRILANPAKTRRKQGK